MKANGDTAIARGTLLRTQTATQDDAYGTVIWEVVATGLVDHERRRAKLLDGVKVVMLGGSGPRAKEGVTLIDSESKIRKDIAAKTTAIITAQERDSLLAQWKAARQKA
jgi:hypothetical protein